MYGKDIILLDSVCTSGGTLVAMYNLLIKAGIVPQQIVEATMLFNEGKDRTEIDVAANVTLKLHRFSTLPIYHVPCNDLKIGLVGSESEIKLSAIRNSLSLIVPGNKWDIVGVPAQSGKPEQPVEEQTLEGAINRANDALSLSPDSDLVIAIESGIFKIPDNSSEGFSWHDKAIIYCLTRDGQSHIYYSKTVKFPTDCVDEARRRGFDKCTVAMVMLEKGLIKNHKDPHADISPFKPRAEYLQEAASLLCKDLFNQQAPSPSVRLTPNL
jgi:non-canonical (house-cleaning) NTP pyrophosphatase